MVLEWGHQNKRHTHIQQLQSYRHAWAFLLMRLEQRQGEEKGKPLTILSASRIGQMGYQKSYWWEVNIGSTHS